VFIRTSLNSVGRTQSSLSQTSLDPKFIDIRLLRADQAFCGVISCFRLVSPHRSFRVSHRSLKSYDVFCKNYLFSSGKQGFEDDSGDSLDDSPGPRQRTRPRGMCMDVQELRGNWQNAENPENRGYATESQPLFDQGSHLRECGLKRSKIL
jgi:hypothetical protein